VKQRKRKRPLRERAEQLLELPSGTLTAVPRVELTGSGQVMVENSCHLTVYEEDEICLATVSGTLRILGNRLCLSTLSTEGLVIRGQILSVEFIE